MNIYRKNNPYSRLYRNIQENFATLETYANDREDGKRPTKPFPKPVEGGRFPAPIALLIVLFVVMIIVSILNIVGIIYQFKCKYTILGILSTIGLFFGLPFGMIFYIIYLVNPSICKE